jgi:Rrf2 family protein
MSAKAEYAVRAMVQLATVDEGVLVKTDDVAKAQGIPPQFLVDILSDLRTDRLVRSHRGRDGGYELARPAADISIADVLRCIDGPLASVRDISLADVAAGALPTHVAKMADDYLGQEERRGHGVG